MDFALKPEFSGKHTFLNKFNLKICFVWSLVLGLIMHWRPLFFRMFARFKRSLWIYVALDYICKTV